MNQDQDHEIRLVNVIQCDTTTHHMQADSLNMPAMEFRIDTKYVRLKEKNEKWKRLSIGLSFRVDMEHFQLHNMQEDQFLGLSRAV